ncbi:MAG: NADH-quinone oxidoreductase subunit NuoF [Planctomycetes bacterium]|nr:NADH-quinone oxidoreductase subunit NuoF [Planctomycetota bacterium]
MPLIISANFGRPNSDTLAGYLANGGYEGLKKAFSLKPGQVMDEVKKSGLRGRGGAGFPTGVKWSFLDTKSGKPIYMCVNADESEPGTFKDRHIINRDPHLLLEGIAIACYAVGCRHAFIYIRGEFFKQAKILERAVAEAVAGNYLGERILGTEFSLKVVVHRGAGAYICGEETGLINSLEGNKGQPRIKPPFPAVSGLYGCPTVVNNVETLAAVPWILRNGGEAYAKIGTPKSTGTKMFCVSGPVRNPNWFEKDMGYPLRDLLNRDAGGMCEGLKLKACIPGGSSMPILTADEVEKANLDYESMNALGSFLGSGGIVAIPHTFSMVSLARNLASFYAHESCGQCTPCREGSGWVHRLLVAIEAGRGRPGDLELLHDLCNNMRAWATGPQPILKWIGKDEGLGGGKTICVFSDALAWPIQSYLVKFRSEFEEAIAKARPSVSVGQVVPGHAEQHSAGTRAGASVH